MNEPHVRLKKEVVLDLLALYQAGEASEATRVLVEEILDREPELARLAQAGDTSSALSGLDHPFEETESLDKEIEVNALERTRRWLRTRSTLQALAIFFTLLPLSMVGAEGQVAFVFADRPVAVAVILALAIGLWTAFFALRSKLRTVGV